MRISRLALPAAFVAVMAVSTPPAAAAPKAKTVSPKASAPSKTKATAPKTTSSPKTKTTSPKASSAPKTKTTVASAKGAKAKSAPATAKNTTKGSTKSAKGTKHTTATASTSAAATSTAVTTSAGSTGDSTSTNAANTGADTAWKPTNAVSEKLVGKPKQLERALAVLPQGTDLNDATKNFKNFGQFNAAVNASRNLGIEFADLKAAMTGYRLDGTAVNDGTATKSLGQAIKELRPGVNADAEATKATTQATAEGGQ